METIPLVHGREVLPPHWHSKQVSHAWPWTVGTTMSTVSARAMFVMAGYKYDGV